MNNIRQPRLSSQRGMTLVELLIGVLLAGIIGAASLEFYSAQHELYLAQTDISERQGNLRVGVNEIARQIRQAGYAVAATAPLRISPGFDTLEIYTGNPAGTNVDTTRYYVNRYDSPPSLVKQINQATPTVYATGIDSAIFVPTPLASPTRVAIVLVSVEQDQFENSALTTRRRLGENVSLRNR